MPSDARLITRKEFLAAAGASIVASAVAAESIPRKVLIVVAHPDDEYAVAGSTYRLVHELGWTVDEFIITNGEAGYRYSALAEAIYGVPLANEKDGRANLPAIRKEEASRAGKILGIRRHYFQDQKDLGFATDAVSSDSSNWDRQRLLESLSTLLVREQYGAVFTLLPTAETHGHHRAATLLALEAVSRLPEDTRPLVFGAEPRPHTGPQPAFAGLREMPLTATVSAAPSIVFDRTGSFGYHNALNYQIVVNWVIAEHKSQGLFQTDTNRHDLEQLWLFSASGERAVARAAELRSQLCG